MTNKNRVGPFAFIKGAIRDEISLVIFKTLVGAVLASIVVYAIIQAGVAFQVLAQQFVNGYVFELIVFGLLALVASAGLYFLFQSSISRNLESQSVAAVDYDLLLLKFAEGFVDGLVEKNEQQTKDEQANAERTNEEQMKSNQLSLLNNLSAER